MGHNHNHSHGAAQQSSPTRFYIFLFGAAVISVLFFWNFLSFSTWVETIIAFIVWQAISLFILLLVFRVPNAGFPRFAVNYAICVFPLFLLSLLVVNKSDNGVGAFHNQRYVHLDFKTVPKVEYIEKVFPYIKQWGATGVLLEWDSSLPYTGTLEAVRSPDAYSEAEVNRILKSAIENELEVIPLVPALDQLDFVLKHFPDLRQHPAKHSAISSSSQSWETVQSLLTQVLKFHSPIEINAVHIGGAKDFLQQRTAEEFVPYVQKTAEFIKDASNIPTILIWNDSPSQWPAEFKDINDLVQVVIRNTNSQVSRPDLPLSPESNVFGKKIWAAGAYKSAESEQRVFTDIHYHASNAWSWMTIWKERAADFQGIFLTGPAKTSSGQLGELLPASLPSLALDLSILKQGLPGSFLKQEVFEELELPDLYSNAQLAAITQSTSSQTGNFPGSEAFHLLATLQAAIKAKDTKQLAELVVTHEKLESSLATIFKKNTVDQYIKQLKTTIVL